MPLTCSRACSLSAASLTVTCPLNFECAILLIGQRRRWLLVALFALLLPGYTESTFPVELEQWYELLSTHEKVRRLRRPAYDIQKAYEAARHV